MVIWVCDDEPEVPVSIRQMLLSHFAEQHTVQCYTGQTEIIADARRVDVEKPDLLISDIRLHGENGIDTASILQAIVPEMKVIFFTGYPNSYYEIVFERVKPFAFLTKPVNEEKLCRYVSEVQKFLRKNEHTISVSYNGDMLQIPTGQILYLENDMRLLRIHCVRNKIEVYGSLKKLLQEWSGEFVQCHSSFAVNMRYVKCMEKGQFILMDGSIVPISRTFEKEVRIRYFTERGNVE